MGKEDRWLLRDVLGRPGRAVLGVAVLGAILGTGAWAQEGEADVGEADISTGLAFGATGTNVAVAGAMGISIDRYLVVMMEGGYIPMGNKTLVIYPGVVAHSSGLYDFNCAFQIRVPLRSKWEPYGILAPALIYNHYQRQVIHPDGRTYYFGASDVKFGFETGGGVRYYLRKDWGFKGEYRDTISTRNFSSILAGVFRQF
jgi:hypothetical protein